MRNMIGTIRQGMNAAVDFAASQIPGEDGPRRMLSPIAHIGRGTHCWSHNVRTNDMVRDQGITVLPLPKAIEPTRDEHR